jgi:hypothetical protein
MSASPSYWVSVLAYLAPVLVVWLVGAILARARWQRHPQVSAGALISLACMLVAFVGQQVGFHLVLNYMRQAGQSMATVGLPMSIVAIVASLVRTAGWLAILISVFGWRPLDRSKTAERLAPLQFSIRALLALTLAVALLCGLGRGLVALMGESAGVLLNLLDDVPIVVCWLCGAWIARTRWAWHPGVSRLALLAIGLSLGMFLIFQSLWIFVRTMGLSPTPLQWINILSGPISAAAWASMLTAALGWREGGNPFGDPRRPRIAS